jgi:hypothetical protein
MQSWSQRLTAIGHVVTFDYPYMAAGRRAPNPLPQLIAAHCDALDRARSERAGPIVLIGKSMGGRVGCHVAQRAAVAGVICFGYPLVGAGKRRPLRDQVLLATTTPMLFVQGSRDRLCPLELLETVRERMPVASELHVVSGGDHSLQLASGRRDPRAQQLSDDAVQAAIATFVAKVAR